ncbi:MAG: HEAT repeat domain-containing protein [Kofleriaceae bacterium]|nr:HEAT repeat domain-containing protein [Kofleriaceae bacterium]
MAPASTSWRASPTTPIRRSAPPRCAAWAGSATPPRSGSCGRGWWRGATRRGRGRAGPGRRPRLGRAGGRRGDHRRAAGAGRRARRPRGAHRAGPPRHRGGAPRRWPGRWATTRPRPRSRRAGAGPHGRRDLGLDDAGTAAALARADDPEPGVRYAAVYALVRGFVAATDGAAPPRADDAIAALVARLDDPDAEIRALAIVGLGRRHAGAAARHEVERRLQDPDWRVAVEAVRVLAGAGAEARELEAVAVTALRTWTLLLTGDAPPARAHVILEALRLLLPHGDVAVVRDTFAALHHAWRDAGAGDPPALHLVAAHGRALLIAATLRGAADPDAAADAWARLVGFAEAPAVARGPLIAEALAARAATDPAAIDLLIATIAKADLASAALGEVAAVWPRADASQRARLVELTVAALGTTRTDVIGGAADAAAALLAPPAAAPAATLDAPADAPAGAARR